MQGCHFLKNLEKSGKLKGLEKSGNFVRYLEIHLNSCEFLCIDGIPLRIAANDKKIQRISKLNGLEGRFFTV